MATFIPGPIPLVSASKAGLLPAPPAGAPSGKVFTDNLTLEAQTASGSGEDGREIELQTSATHIQWRAELAVAVQERARERDLPEDFIAALWTAPPPATAVGQEWTTPDGTLWRVAQDRDAEGRFLADDPDTEVRESLIWVRADTIAETPAGA